MKIINLLLISCLIFNYSYGQSIDKKGRRYIESKNVGSARNIRNGKVCIISIFASKGDSAWTKEEKKHFISKQQKALNWISKETLRYGTKVDFIQETYYSGNSDFKLNTNLLVNSRGLMHLVGDNLTKETLRALNAKGFDSTHNFITFARKKHGLNDVLVLIYVKGKGQSFARPYCTNSPPARYLEVALICEKNLHNNPSSTSTIAHEILHFVGAWDLYAVVPEDKRRTKLAQKKLTKSIFLTTRKNINYHTIDELTAWRIGLTKGEQWYLKFIPKNYFYGYGARNSN